VQGRRLNAAHKTWEIFCRTLYDGAFDGQLSLLRCARVFAAKQSIRLGDSIRGTRDRFIDAGCAETAADIDQPVKIRTFPAGRLMGSAYSICHSRFANYTWDLHRHENISKGSDIERKTIDNSPTC
jgi:hypothetical protein